MEQYILKLSSGTSYNLYQGTTLVADADITTLFATAGSAYFSFDFNGGTPTDTTSLSIINSESTAVITNTGLSGIAEGKNFKGTWSASATAFDSFTALTGKTLDESEVSFVMGKIKERPIVGSTLSTPSNVAYVATANIQDGAVTSDKIDCATYLQDTEQIVGTWIDGKPLYRKIYETGTLTSGETVVDTISGINVKRLFAWFINTNGAVQCYGAYRNNVADDTSRVLYDGTYVKVQQGSNWQNSGNHALVEIQYTKTTA